MHYICVENKQIVSVLNYKPNTNMSPKVSVTEITDEQEHAITIKKTHMFDVDSLSVRSLPKAELLINEKKKLQNKNIMFLNESDWMILRHIREKHLNLETTLSEKQYTELETSRQEAAKGI